MMYTQSLLRTSAANDNYRAEDLIALPDQADDLLAMLVAMDKLVHLYPHTFRMLLLAAREALRPMSIEARLDGHSPTPIAVRWES
jgi:hypothetical protein